MKKIILSILLLVLSGCSSQIAVTSLESAIRNAANAAKKATGNAATTFEIEVTTVNAYDAEAKSPIQVVPINVSTSLEHTTRIKTCIELKNYIINYEESPNSGTSKSLYPGDNSAQAPSTEILYLNKKTGKLSSSPK